MNGVVQLTEIVWVGGWKQTFVKLLLIEIVLIQLQPGHIGIHVFKVRYENNLSQNALPRAQSLHQGLQNSTPNSLRTHPSNSNYSVDHVRCLWTEESAAEVGTSRLTYTYMNWQRSYRTLMQTWAMGANHERRTHWKKASRTRKKEPIGSGDGKHLYRLTNVTSTFFRRTSSPKNNLGNLLR